MEYLRLEEIAKRFGLTQCDIAIKTRLSNGMISKIKNGNITITKDTQNRFIEAFGVGIYNGEVRWKEEYLKEKQMREKAEAELKELKSLLKQLKHTSEFILKKIK